MKRQPTYRKGDRIGGRFLVHQALMGGMGEVYLCLDTKENLPFALKTFIGTSPRLKEVFHDEVAKWVALESHPNIVRCHWMNVLDNRPFAGMDWIASDESRGTDLRAWIRAGGLDIRQALLFTVDIVRGLIYAGEKVPGIVHRDLKPENVLVNQARQAKVNDFGLALVAQKAELEAGMYDSDPSPTQSLRVGHIVGTPLYMAPEQWRGEVDLDARTDLYAVGCILYELLTGEFAFKPPSGISTQSAFRRAMEDLHSNAPIPALPPHLPPTLQEILENCLAKTYVGRYGNLTSLLEALEQVYQTAFEDRLPEVTAEEFTAIDYSNRGATFGNLGQHQRAIEDYDRALQLDPNLAQAYYNRGNSYTDLGQHQRAIEDYDRTIQLDSNLAQAYTRRGNSYAALGQHQRAIEDYDRAIQLNPNDAHAYYNRGNRYAALWQHQRAIEDYDRAIQRDPNLAIAYNNRGKSYSNLGQHQRAIEDYDRAIQRDPNDALAWLNKAVATVQTGELDAAIELGLRAAQLGAPRALEVVNMIRQVKGEAPIQPQPNQQEQALQQVIRFYQQYGEARLRQLMGHQGLSVTQIDELISMIKQALKER